MSSTVDGTAVGTATIRLTIPAKPEYITLGRLALTGIARLRPGIGPEEVLGALSPARRLHPAVRQTPRLSGDRLRAPRRQRRSEVAGRLRNARLARADGRDQAAGRAAAREARPAPLGHRVRRRRGGDQLHARAADG